MITTTALNFMIGQVFIGISTNLKIAGLTSTNTIITTYGTIAFGTASNGIRALSSDVVLQATQSGTITKLRIYTDTAGDTMITVDISPTVAVSTGQYVTVLASGTTISLGNPA